MSCVYLFSANIWFASGFPVVSVPWNLFELINWVDWSNNIYILIAILLILRRNGLSLWASSCFSWDSLLPFFCLPLSPISLFFFSTSLFSVMKRQFWSSNKQITNEARWSSGQLSLDSSMHSFLSFSIPLCHVHKWRACHTSLQVPFVCKGRKGSSKFIYLFIKQSINPLQRMLDKFMLLEKNGQIFRYTVGT